jgi:hypothetical protein
MPAAHATPLSVAIFFAAGGSLLSHAREHRVSDASRKETSRRCAITIHRLTVFKPPERLRGSMKKSLPLLLCVLLSTFTMARATNRAHTFALETKSAPEFPIEPQADANAFVTAANTEEEEPSSDDDENTGDASDDEGENTNDNAADATDDENTGNDDEGTEDGSDDGGGSQGQ